MGAPGAAGAIGAGFAAAGGASGASVTTLGSGAISDSRLATSGGSATVSGAGFGLTIVAAGLISAGDSSSVTSAAFFDRAGAFFVTGAPSVAVVSVAAFGLTARFGFGSSGSSRPRPSLTRSAFASVVSRGLMARSPL